MPKGSSDERTCSTRPSRRETSQSRTHEAGGMASPAWRPHRVDTTHPGTQGYVLESADKDLRVNDIRVFKGTYRQASRSVAGSHHRRYRTRPIWASVILDDDIERIKPDYSLYPKFTGSLGFTQRGCRLSCKFCVVPIKEGKNR